uniref:Cathepsin L n=1 Tax=Riptortus pedestris TaxID=329032 RepID=R4WCH2_RIPPE|nr:cathepsin L [Riptortus pedestris]
MNTAILLTVCMVTVSHAVPLLQDWHHFKEAFGKVYSDPQEEKLRKDIFLKHKSLIDEHNSLYKEGKVTFEMGINEFADLMDEEFRLLMLNQGLMAFSPRSSQLHQTEGTEEEGEVDWRQKGAVTGVKNQGMCGSCWAFSVTGSLEGHHYVKNNELVALSEQNLVDCAKGPKYRNQGCGGGWMTDSFRYILDNGGIDTAASYPYEARNGRCRFNNETIGARVSGYTEIPKDDEDALRDAVQNKGPVSVAIDASLYTFRFYRRGVYQDPLCGLAGLNHAVLAVGYGHHKKADYWLVKNSWGTAWGDSGYIKMRRNHKNHCGIATFASYPNV